jgi:hypothetical protein
MFGLPLPLNLRLQTSTGLAVSRPEGGGENDEDVAAIAATFVVVAAAFVAVVKADHGQPCKPLAAVDNEPSWHVLVSIKNVLVRLVRMLPTSGRAVSILPRFATT